MAINTFTGSCDKVPFLPLSSLNTSKGSIIPNRLIKSNFGTDSSVTSSNKSKIRKNTFSKSPYLNNEKVHLLSRVTEKKVVQNKAADFVSSFPLAINIYKANSDEFKSMKKNKRPKKSVLTLPNKQAPVPQTCTVSDMNDSEELNHNDDNRKKRPKKRPTGQNRRSRNNFEFYDRDARYCSQFNIHLDCSSTEVINNFNGDGKKALSRKKQRLPPKAKIEGNFNGHDVWRVLRNINRFQFRPSPPTSEDEIPLPGKKGNKLRFNRKDTRLIETCRTEEFAYISSIEVDSKTPLSFSHSSSFDRVTVIDKQDELSRICEEFEKRIAKTQNVAKNTKTPKLSKNKSITKKTFRTGSKGLGTKENQSSTVTSSIGMGMQHFYENNAFDTTANCRSSNGNDDSLTFNARIDVEKIKNNEHFVNSLPNDQMQSSIDRSEAENFIYSTNSASSKAGLQEVTKVYRKISEEIKNQPINGITKLVLSKGQNVVHSRRLETPKRKSRLATTLTSTPVVPKLTQNDIRRRLLNIKFPLVILGKDQVSSTIQVMDDDAPQFDGLDKHIWPFMIDWSEDNILKEEVDEVKCNELLNFDPPYESDFNRQKRKCHHSHGDYKFIKAPGMKSETNKLKQQSNKERKCSIESKSVLNNRDRNEVTLILDANKETQQPKKQTPMRQLKDKMLKLLYKKPLASDVSEDAKIEIRENVKYPVNRHISNNIFKKVDVCLNNNNIEAKTINNYATKRQLSPRLVDTTSVAAKRPWCKAKWASEFIENVIKKIKNGVYYNQDLKYDVGKTCIVVKEASIQTRSISDDSKRLTPDANAIEPPEQLSQRNELLKPIPGFDNSLLKLEVKTLNTNKIEIKNLLNNIIVQFDITVSKESDKFDILAKKSCSLIQLEKNDSNTTLFKCKATIHSAMLPAELCSILPNMMHKIVHPEKILNHPLPINKTNSQLSTISEISHSEGFDCFKSIQRLSTLSPAISRILSGKFSHSIKNQQTIHKTARIAYYSSEIQTNLLPKIPEKVFLSVVIAPLENIFKIIKNTNIDKHTNTEISNSNCQTLQVYNSQAHSLIPAGQTNNITTIFENFWASYAKTGCSGFYPPRCVYTISFDVRNKNIGIKNIVMNIGNFKLNSMIENYEKINEYNSRKALKDIDYVSTKICNPATSDCKAKTVKVINQTQGSNHKLKRKGYVKLYKKCKSTSNIPNEKSSLPLTKIVTLDDFFQLLGSKSLSCVFDGNSSKKILSSIITMKNWISEISSRQAILVLLLANKKDTPNLIRFRPVLLQGIAVNRITRASELDMEIEVIERENLCVISQFEGISYLPASTENKDNLLEELYWIAKTTASDYQRPFDESSEKLLKSLLEKRKTLNPSYLRVMARYVGLGLLKSPSKK